MIRHFSKGILGAATFVIAYKWQNIQKSCWNLNLTRKNCCVCISDWWQLIWHFIKAVYSPYQRYQTSRMKWMRSGTRGDTNPNRMQGSLKPTQTCNISELVPDSGTRWLKYKFYNKLWSDTRSGNRMDYVHKTLCRTCNTNVDRYTMKCNRVHTTTILYALCKIINLKAKEDQNEQHHSCCIFCWKNFFYC